MNNKNHSSSHNNDSDYYYSVEALECSYMMVIIANTIFNEMIYKNHTFTLYPYSMDYFTNEVDILNRYQSIIFPDVVVNNNVDTCHNKNCNDLLCKGGDIPSDDVDVPSDVPSDIPTDIPSDVSSDYPSMIESDIPTLMLRAHDLFQAMNHPLF
jgi:N2227-like protein